MRIVVLLGTLCLILQSVLSCEKSKVFVPPTTQRWEINFMYLNKARRPLQSDYIMYIGGYKDELRKVRVYFTTDKVFGGYSDWELKNNTGEKPSWRLVKDSFHPLGVGNIAKGTYKDNLLLLSVIKNPKSILANKDWMILETTFGAELFLKFVD